MFKTFTAFLVSFGIVGWVAMIVLWVLAIIGYFINLIWLIKFAITGGAGYVLDQPEVIKLVFRGVGVFFAPLGAAMGWFA